jgi:uncharacterized protein
MSDELFIDSHVHILPEKRLRGLMRWIKRSFPGHPVAPDIGERQILADLAGRGVTHFFNMAYPLKQEETDPLNQWNLDFCRKTPGAIAVASMHQDTGNKAGLARRLLETGAFLGFKFHPFVQRFDPWDRRMTPLYDFLEEVRRPLFIHTGFEDFYGLSMPVSELEGMMKRHPRLPLVLVHMAFPEIEWAFRMLDEYPDLYLDATNVLALFRPVFRPLAQAIPDGDRVMDMIVEGMATRPERIMFGSDHPAGMGGIEDIHRDLDSLPIPEEARTAIRSHTPRALVERFLPGFDWGPRLGVANPDAVDLPGVAPPRQGGGSQ